MDKKFLTAFVLPKYFEIYGFKLRPLCAKSLIALYAVNSPFVCNKEPSNQDILDFLRICSVDFNGFYELKDISWSQKYFYFKLKYAPIFKVRVLMCIKMFVEESTATPLVRIKSRIPMPKQSVLMDKESLPELLMLVSLLMSKFGLSESEALEMPIGRAACYSVAYAALEGGDVAMVPEEKDGPEVIRSEIAKHEKAMAERMRLAMSNGKIPKRRIKTRES